MSCSWAVLARWNCWGHPRFPALSAAFAPSLGHAPPPVHPPADEVFGDAARQVDGDVANPLDNGFREKSNQFHPLML